MIANSATPDRIKQTPSVFLLHMTEYARFKVPYRALSFVDNMKDEHFEVRE